MTGTGKNWKKQKRCEKCGCWVRESYIGDIINKNSGRYVSKTTRLCKAHKLELLFNEANKSTQVQIIEHKLNITRE